MKSLQLFLKEKRKQVGLTQTEFADRAGVALTVIRKIEQGKGNLNMETVNHVLLMFGHALAPVPAKTIESNQEKEWKLISGCRDRGRLSVPSTLNWMPLPKSWWRCPESGPNNCYRAPNSPNFLSPSYPKTVWVAWRPIPRIPVQLRAKWHWQSWWWPEPLRILSSLAGCVWTWCGCLRTPWFSRPK